MGFLNFLFGKRHSSKNLIELLENGDIVVDVRTPGEFKEEHAENSINISLQKIPRELATLKAKGTTIILCCRNGARSYFAQTQL